MRNNQQAVILKVYVSAIFLMLSTFAVAIDKEMVTVALAVTVTDDSAKVSQKNVIENDIPGITPESSVSSVIFSDINGNRKQDAGEMGVAGLTIKIFDEKGISEVNVGPDGTLGTLDDSPGGMITDASGGYHFDNLKPNNYRVIVTAE